MNGKNGGHKSAPPVRAGHISQEQKQQNGRRCVKNEVRKMVTTGVQSVDLEIQHVGNSGQRVPVGRVKMSERPGKRAKT